MTLKSLVLVALTSATFAATSGCGAPPNVSGVTEARGPLVSRKMESYVQDFVNLYGHAIDQIPISVGPLEKKVAGICYYPHGKDAADQIADSVLGASTQPQRRVVINTSFYQAHLDDPDDGAIQNVIFHELGHCILGRGHDKGTMASEFGNVPNSIMYPSAFGMKSFYGQYRAHYLQELFQNIRPGEDPATDPRGSGNDE